MVEGLRASGKPVSPKMEELAAWLDSMQESTDMGEVRPSGSRGYASALGSALGSGRDEMVSLMARAKVSV